MSTRLFAGLVVLHVALAHPSAAGLISVLSSRTVTWDFVQKTGGMRLGAPEKQGDRWVLPIDYSVSGTRTVTRTPELVNSALVVRRASASVDRRGALVIRITVSLPDAEHKSSDAPPADLSAVPPGIYAAFYGSGNASASSLGTVSIPAKD